VAYNKQEFRVRSSSCCCWCSGFTRSCCCSYRWIWEPEVASDSRKLDDRQRKPGVPGDLGNKEFWVIPGKRSSGWYGKPEFWVTQGTRISGWIREPEDRENEGKRSSVWLRELGVMGDSLNSEFRVTRRTRTEPGDTGHSRNSELRVTSRTRNRLPGTYGNPQFRMNPRTRSTGWLREPGVPRNTGNQEIRVIPGFRVTPGTWNLELHEKPEFRLTTGTRSSG